MRAGVFVIPVVDDMLEQVSIAAARHLTEEVAAEHLAAIGQAVISEVLCGSLDDMGPFEDDASQTRVRTQNAGYQRPVAAADVDNRAECRKVIDGRNRHGDLRGE